MSAKVFGIIIIVLAVVMGILASVVPVSHIMNVLLVMKFFNAMIPILAVGALIKYVASGNSKE